MPTFRRLLDQAIEFKGLKNSEVAELAARVVESSHHLFPENFDISEGTVRFLRTSSVKRYGAHHVAALTQALGLDIADVKRSLGWDLVDRVRKHQG